MKKGFIIAIDGPLASGKGTIAKKLAHVLHGVDLNTGALYRGVALYCINSGVNLKNTEDVIAQLDKITIDYRDNRIMLNGIDITEAVQEAAIAEGASLIAVIPEVRKELVKRQQMRGQAEMDKGRIVVVEGRDIGSVVFPDAALKIYLTASETVRAKRRFSQYHKMGEKETFDEVLDQIRTRDRRDKERKASPLTDTPAKLGYFVLDNTAMNEDQTIDAILAELKRRKLYD